MQLNDERSAWLIKQLAIKDPLSKIKEQYSRLFEDKISGEELIKFEIINRKMIETVARRELNNIKMEPLAHARTRLRILNDMLTYAMTPKATKSVPIRAEGKNIEYEVTYEPDYAAVNNLIKTAQNEEFFIKKLILEVKKSEIPTDQGTDLLSTGFEVIEINDGLKKITTNGSE